MLISESREAENDCPLKFKTMGKFLLASNKRESARKKEMAARVRRGSVRVLLIGF